jgi:phosphoribosylaminoimidazolecarboxamide formyltransferase/IMP cyclohydrolase
VVANTSLKYAQSNSVAYAYDGQLVGLGAGQQSRVDCVKLAGRKTDIWFLRSHPKVLSLHNKFVPKTKRQTKVNACIRYIEGDFTPIEKTHWNQLFIEPIEPLTEEEKRDYLSTLQNVALASDAFFPFRDNIDHCSKRGVSCIVQPGGSIADPQIIEACNEYNITMCLSGVRVFTH